MDLPGQATNCTWGFLRLRAEMQKKKKLMRKRRFSQECVKNCERGGPFESVDLVVALYQGVAVGARSQDKAISG